MKGRALVAGETSGRVVSLDGPLSFWGGFDSERGVIIDEHHPQVGTDLRGAVVVMTAGRGSSSASSVMAEAARRGTAPAAIVLAVADEIITTGAVVADELYGVTIAVIVVDADDHEALRTWPGAAVALDGSVHGVDR